MDGISVIQPATFVNLGFDAELSDLRYSRKAGQEDVVISTVPSTTSPPVTYSWENIEVYVKGKKRACSTHLPQVKSKILANVTGYIGPGEFLAILGASGAGKTTLLNCLTFRTTGKLKVLGQRYLNGTAVNIDTLARFSGYVQQHDLFIPALTVKEHLRFQALLRMDKILSYDERMTRVTETIQELGLTKCMDTVIGSAEIGIKGISGGERKRLAFASEILTNPSLIFCDEPTSGLDSYMAQNIIQVLKKIALTGKAVVCTIHQPSSDVFALFDRILLMAEGRVAFLGPVADALSFFSNQSLHCPPNYNPADFYIRTLATVPGEEAESKRKITEICDAYESSKANHLVLAVAKANRSINSSTSGQKDQENEESIGCTVKNSPYKASWLAQFRAVYWRSNITIFRHVKVLKAKSFQTVFIAVVLALIFQGHTLEYFTVHNIQGGISIILCCITFINVYGVVTVFVNELPIFLRENRDGMYRTDVYFLSKTTADMPIYIFFSFVFIAITYFAIGMNISADRFFIAWGIILLVINAVTSFGYLISCLASSVNIALESINPLVTPLLYVGGFFLREGTVPVYLDWLRYLSWFRYGNEALSINQWDGVKFNDTACPNGVCTGEDILKHYDYDPDFFYGDIIGLFGLIFGFRLLAFLALLSKTYR